MNVQQLRKKLKKMPQEAPVSTLSDRGTIALVVGVDPPGRSGAAATAAAMQAKVDEYGVVLHTKRLPSVKKNG